MAPKNLKKLVILLTCSGLLTGFSAETTLTDPPSVIDLTKAFFENSEKIKSLKYQLHKRERISGQLITQKTHVKLTKEPFRIYIKQSYPKEGLEVLFAESHNDNKALVNPAGFPWMNLSLDPYGKWMRENQHHTIYDSGFDLIITILKHLYDKYENEVQNMVTYQGTDSRNGIDCYVVSCNNPYFKFITYEVLPGENLLTIAKRNKISEHMILEINKDIENYYDVVPGQIITIPNDYSPKMLIYLNKENATPVLVQVFDNKGLYEEYEYTHLEINPELDPQEFSEDFEEYGF